MELLEKLRGKLVVSCQPVDHGPMDRPDIVVAMSLAVLANGAAGLRIEGIANLKAVRPVTDAPIIGIVKQGLTDSDVRITPFAADIDALASAGANIIAYDATNRVRPVPTDVLLAQIRAAGCLAMADCASLADGKRAVLQGADIIGTTLSGYAYEIADEGAGPDLDLIAQFAKLGPFVMAEGRFNTPADAAAAIAAGADSVTVGSAITRIEIVTDWFASAVANNDRN